MKKIVRWIVGYQNPVDGRWGTAHFDSYGRAWDEYRAYRGFGYKPLRPHRVAIPIPEKKEKSRG